MKLRLALVLFCLLGIGVFSHAQSKKEVPKPPVIVDIPVTVKSSKHRKPPPPPKPPKGEKVKFAPPRIVKDKQNAPPPPPPLKPGGVKFAPPKIVKDKQNVPPPPPKPSGVKPGVQLDQNGKRIPPPPPKDDITHFKAPAKLNTEKPAKPITAEVSPPSNGRA
ncbi:MAG: hypothetical protein V4539_07790 [Bacteroidota bacterium]